MQIMDPRRNVPLPPRGGIHTGDASLADDAAFAREMAQDSGFTLMDLLHEVSDFSTGVLGDVKDLAVGYGQNAAAVAQDPIASLKNTPSDLMAMGKGMVHDWTHPLEYANRDPLWFMLDLMGAGAIAGKGMGVGRRLLSGADDTLPIPRDVQAEQFARGGIDEATEAGIQDNFANSLQRLLAEETGGGEFGREPNRMVPTPLLRKLRDAQMRNPDSPEVAAIVHEIDAAVQRTPDISPSDPRIAQFTDDIGRGTMDETPSGDVFDAWDALIENATMRKHGGKQVKNYLSDPGGRLTREGMLLRDIFSQSRELMGDLPDAPMWDPEDIANLERQRTVERIMQDFKGQSPRRTYDQDIEMQTITRGGEGGFRTPTKAEWEAGELPYQYGGRNPNDLELPLERGGLRRRWYRDDKTGEVDDPYFDEHEWEYEARDFENQLAAQGVPPQIDNPYIPGDEITTLERLLMDLADEGIPEGYGRYVSPGYRPRDPMLAEFMERVMPLITRGPLPY